MEPHAPHIPVLYHEVLSGLDIQPNGMYIDCTIGAGGHAEGVLKASAPDGRLLGLDADPHALEISRQRLMPFKNRVILVHSNFVHLGQVANELGWVCVDGILLDLGVSSMQLESPERGFSFLLDGPLDMRYDPGAGQTAAELVSTLSEQQLVDVIYRYGEEPAARSIARAIVAARPLHTTAELAELVARVVRRNAGSRGKRSGRGGRREVARHHPATRTFQALRIAVNAELNSLEQVLQDALTLLKPGGRLAVITFHSLEDRIVKRFLLRESRDCICPPRTMVCTCGHRATVEQVTRKPVQPQDSEVDRNPRSRSAKLRVAAKR
jgi:16S rRNA (cytosine1402-N4)-methyltransferase